jgi:hypothetical protein
MRKFILVAAMVLASAGVAQAGGSRSLSLAGSDSKAVQDSARTAEPASAVETQRAPKAADAGATGTPASTERQKFAERPPGVDIRRQQSQRQSQMQSRQSRMSAGAGRRAQMAQMKQMHMHRPGHIRLWSTARIVATLHRHGIYW